MNNNNVFTFDPQGKQERERRESLLHVLDEMRRRVESGEIKEFVACSLADDGLAQIHASVLDLPGGVGLFEIGKHMLIQAEQEDF